MKFVFSSPVAKARHRTKVIGRRVLTYDPQSTEKKLTKNQMANTMRENKYALVKEGPVSIVVDNYVKIPESLSQKQKDALDGTPCDKRPDVDNYCKWIFDILNEIAYTDDGQIARMYSEKTYSKNPRVEVELIKIGNFMINEHALTINGQLTSEQISYMVKKANRLGLQHRQIANVFSHDDEEGHHIYFETDSLLPRQEILRGINEN